MQKSGFLTSRLKFQASSKPMAAQAALSDLVTNAEDRFSCDKTRIYKSCIMRKLVLSISEQQ